MRARIADWLRRWADWLCPPVPLLFRRSRLRHLSIERMILKEQFAQDRSGTIERRTLASMRDELGRAAVECATVEKRDAFGMPAVVLRMDLGVYTPYD